MDTKNRGFTLIEVLLVLVTTGVIISIGSINLNSYLRKLHLNQATSELVASLKSMSDDALRFSQRIELDEYSLAEGNIIWSSTEKQFGNIKLSHGAIISNVEKSAPMHPIWFTGRGIPFQQTSFTIEINQLQSEVILLPTGLVIRK